LIESLKRAGHHRAAAEIHRFQAVQIVLAGESVGHESLIGHNRKILVDDMKMAIKIFRVCVQRVSPLKFRLMIIADRVVLSSTTGICDRLKAGKIYRQTKATI
jgi:hypothetical protein